MRRSLLLTAAAAALFAGPAFADNLTLTVEGLHSSEGQVLASLCGDRAGQFPGRCMTYAARAKAAAAGATVLTFHDVKPGAYALQVVHDENGDGTPQIPPEGYAFGNGVAYPPAFDAAAVQVTGDAQARVRIAYFAAPTRPTGSKGAEPGPGVVRTDVRENGLYGEFYAPEHRKPLPTIILLGGSEGGLTISSMAESFTAKGYAVLALAYWAEQGLPDSLEMIPLEYFDRAVAWVKARPEADGRIGVIGWSRGSEAAMLLASRNRDVRAVAAIAPSGVVWQGLNFANMATPKPAWTAGGKPLPSLMPAVAAYRPTGPMTPIFTLALTDADRRPETAIPIERANGPVLLISGGQDNLWPSTTFAGRVVARLQGAGFHHAVEHLDYPEAGHAIFVGAPDGAMAKWAAAPNPMLGGSPEANARAWADNWPKTVAFFDKALKEDAR